MRLRKQYPCHIPPPRSPCVRGRDHSQPWLKLPQAGDQHGCKYDLPLTMPHTVARSCSYGLARTSKRKSRVRGYMSMTQELVPCRRQPSEQPRASDPNLQMDLKNSLMAVSSWRRFWKHNKVSSCSLQRRVFYNRISGDFRVAGKG